MYQIKIDKSNKSAVFGKKNRGRIFCPYCVNTERIIRIPLMPQGSIGNSGESKIEHEKYVENGNFLLRFPYYKNVRYVNLLGSIPVEVKSGRSSTPPKKNEKVILQMDLFNHLND